uniref:Uncharacterized protein n=1 Tax=Haptolina ericina TaxID=156174 RepID=A0A7S3AM63_9EUKA
MPSLDAYGLPPQPQSQAHDLPTLGTELQEISAEPQLQHLTSMEGQQSASHVPPPTPPPFASPPDKVVTSGGQPSCTPPSIAQNTATFQPVTDEPFRIRIPPALLDRAPAARRGAGRRWKALPRRSVCTGFCTGMGAVTQSVRLLLGTILGWALVSISLVLFLGLAMQLIWVIPLLGLLACLVPSASSAKPAHLRLHSSHVVVVGGSTGLTRAVVLEAVQQGADVTLLAPEGNSLHAVYEEMKLTSMDRLDRSKTATSKAEQRKQQLRCSPLQSHVGPMVCFTALQNVLEVVGRVDALICLPVELVQDFNAAADDVHSGADASEAWQGADLNDPMLCCVWAIRAVAHSMQRSGHGRVLLVGDSARESPLTSATRRLRHHLALHGLADRTRKELGNHTIAVGVVAPLERRCASPPEAVDTATRQTTRRREGLLGLIGISPLHGWDVRRYAAHLIAAMVRGDAFVGVQVGGAKGVLSSHLQQFGFAAASSKWALAHAFVLPLLWLLDLDLPVQWQVCCARLCCRERGRRGYKQLILSDHEMESSLV